jgi:tRNA G18 (ribose-2'-O)-methylase SpoU
MVKKLKLSELNRLSPEEAALAAKKPVILVLDNVRSALNVGSIFRTADAFAIESVYLCGITACPPHREILKTALGATETVNWKYFSQFDEAAIELKSAGYQIAAVEQTDSSITLNQFMPSGKQALVFGNEIDGVSDKALQYCHSFIEIPQYGVKHSLNVAVCAGIILWEVMQKQKAING